MSERVSAVVTTAATPEQAKLFVARLRGAGIPAFVDPDGAADEFAMSQRLMNLTNVKVMVPVSSLELAREILQPTEIDPDELERQALGAGGEHEAAPSPRAEAVMTRSSLEPPERRGGSLLFLYAVFATGAAVLFAYLWRDAKSREIADSWNTRWVPTDYGFEQRERATDRLLAEYHDVDRDGVWDQIIVHGEQAWRSISRRPDEFGFYQEFVVERQGDLTTTSQPMPGDPRGPLDYTRVTDADGKLLQILEWRPNEGFVIRKP